MPTIINWLFKKWVRNALKYIKKRLDDLATAESFADLEFLPGRFHQLKENRKDQWSCDLDHPYRLIFIPNENPIPKNESGVQILIEIQSAEIIEIEDTRK